MENTTGNGRLQTRTRESFPSSEKPTHLDLFSGIGGFALAAQWAGFRTIGFCEIDNYCRKVLAKNFLADAGIATEPARDNGRKEHQSDERQEIRNVNSPSCPRLHENIFDLDGRDFAGVSLITGGFPCQPFSVAGKRGGASDDRAIWPQMFRVISEARPAWVLGENVLGIITMELDNVLSDLEGIGYATQTFVIPACAVDARHRRDRVWIVANAISDLDKRTQRGSDGISGRVAQRDGSQLSASGEPGRTDSEVRRPSMQGHEVPDTSGTGLEGGTATRDTGGGWARGTEQPSGLCGAQDMADTASVRSGSIDDERVSAEPAGSDGIPRESGGSGMSVDGTWCRWEPESDVGRVASGIPSRVDRLKGLGNAIVPQCAYELLREIRKLC